MHLSVVACDLDGTLATDGHIAPETWNVLRQVKAAGRKVLLVTGRALATFAPEGPYAELCDAIVAEDGAVVYFPRRDTVVLPFGHLAPDLLQRLVKLAIPFERGTAILATHVPHDAAIHAVLRDMGGGATVEYNRGAVMVLPPGATKGTGLQFALQELGLSPHNVLACGDAENDRSLFEVAELAVAVANADPPIRALADAVLPEANGCGTRALLTNYLLGNLPPYKLRPERMLVLGHGTGGASVHLDPFAILDGNVGFAGDTGSGKSWLAGLVAEELLKQGYQVCIIDPEGDYRGLRMLPHTLLLGGPYQSLPRVGEVITLSEHARLSLILDLSTCTQEERNSYMIELLHGLRHLRAHHGIPHWLLIDEVQSFCPPEGGELTDILAKLMVGGGIGLISYHPSRVAPALIAALDHWLLTRMTVEQERALVYAALAMHDAADIDLDQLSTLPQGKAYFCGRKGAVPDYTNELLTFRVGPRSVPHIRHLNKYLQLPVPKERQFYFYNGDGQPLRVVAATLWEFAEALSEVPPSAMRYHLDRHDFERWFRTVLHDDQLAQRVGKLGRRELAGEALREALQTLIRERYVELEKML